MLARVTVLCPHAVIFIVFSSCDHSDLSKMGNWLDALTASNFTLKRVKFTKDSSLMMAAMSDLSEEGVSGDHDCMMLSHSPFPHYASIIPYSMLLSGLS